METLITIGGGAGAVLAIGGLLRIGWRANRRIVRIGEVLAELSPNDGKSLKDQVTRIESQVCSLTERFDRHLDDHSHSS